MSDLLEGLEALAELKARIKAHDPETDDATPLLEAIHAHEDRYPELAADFARLADELVQREVPT